MKMTENNQREVARSLLSEAVDTRVWLFNGEMGAGKTTLIKSICEELGVVENMSSPTFSIVNVYEDQKGDPIYHFDFYRMEDELEAADIGAEDYFYSGHFCFIEWPERVPNLIPSDHLKININLVDSLTREVNWSRS